MNNLLRKRLDLLRREVKKKKPGSKSDRNEKDKKTHVEQRVKRASLTHSLTHSLTQLGIGTDSYAHAHQCLLDRQHSAAAPTPTTHTRTKQRVFAANKMFVG